MRGRIAVASVVLTLATVSSAAAPVHASAAVALAPTGPGRHVHVMPVRRRGLAGAAAITQNAAVPAKLTYHGGPVLHATTTYAVFWQPPGTFMTASYGQDIARYLSSVGGTGLYNVLTQYGDAGVLRDNTSVFGGSWTDSSSFPGRGSQANPLTDGDMIGEVRAAAAANPAWVRPGPHAVYLVFLPRGIYQAADPLDESFVQYCAYHSYYTDPATLVDGYYGVMPYAGTDLAGCGTAAPGAPTPSGDADADAEISLVSHEQFETVSDPHLDAWFDAAGNEIADKCQFAGSVGADGGNVTLNGQRFLVQEEFSDQDAACVLTSRLRLALSVGRSRPAAGAQLVLGATPMEVVTKTYDAGYNSTVTVTSTDPLTQFVTPPSYAFTTADFTGHPFTLRLWTAGPQTLTVTDGNGLSATATVTVGASGIVNGDFETGLTGWRSTGSVSSVTSAHGGAFAAQLGSALPGAASSLAQTFVAPFGASQLAIWYRQTCTDVVTHDWLTVTLRDLTLHQTLVLLPRTCTNTGQWAELTSPVVPGDRYKLFLFNRDDGRAGTASSTAFDDVATG